MTNIEKLEALKTNEAFALEMNTAATAADVQNIFAKYDIAFTLEEAQQMLNAAIIGDTGELSADDLDGVNGGNPLFVVLVVATIILIMACYIMSRNRR